MKVSVSNAVIRSKNITPSRWSVSCWMTRAGRPLATSSTRRPCPIERAQPDASRAAAPCRGCPECSRQPSQPSTVGVVGGRHDLRVDHRDERHLGVLGHRRDDIGAAHAGDEQPQPLVHLRRGQPDARVLLHRLEHVVDERLDPRRLDLGRRDGLRLGAQHGMAQTGDLQDGHVGRLYRKPLRARARPAAVRPDRRRRPPRAAPAAETGSPPTSRVSIADRTSPGTSSARSARSTAASDARVAGNLRREQRAAVLVGHDRRRYVPIRCASAVISSLSMPMSGRRTGSVATPPTTARLSIVCDAT